MAHGLFLAGGIFIFGRNIPALDEGNIVAVEVLTLSEFTNISAAVKQPKPKDLIPEPEEPMQLEAPMENAEVESDVVEKRQEDTTEKPPEPEPEVEEPPKGPEHPARHWVQIATGKDRSALRYDWRRLSRKAEGQLDENEPFVAPWGETNRMLTGPYDTLRQARAASDALNALDIDSFAFSSAQDQVIELLP